MCVNRFHNFQNIIIKSLILFNTLSNFVELLKYQRIFQYISYIWISWKILLFSFDISKASKMFPLKSNRCFGLCNLGRGCYDTNSINLKDFLCEHSKLAICCEYPNETDLSTHISVYLFLYLKICVLFCELVCVFVFSVFLCVCCKFVCVCLCDLPSLSDSWCIEVKWLPPSSITLSLPI